jgi:hypothetical protein
MVRKGKSVTDRDYVAICNQQFKLNYSNLSPAR